LGAGEAQSLELTLADRTRIFNLGYFTWVEQRGVGVDEFTVRARPKFWQGLVRTLEEWDYAIARLNEETAMARQD
jgi:cysteine synthase A